MHYIVTLPEWTRLKIRSEARRTFSGAMFSQISWSGTLKIEIEGNRGNLRLSHNANLSSAKPRIRAPPLFRDQKSPNHFALGSVTEPVSHKLTVVTQLRVERSNLEIGKTSMGAAPKKRTTSLFPISLSSFFPPNREREKGSERKKGGKGTRTWRKGRLPFLVRSIPGNSHSIFSTTWLHEALALVCNTAPPLLLLSVL